MAAYKAYFKASVEKDLSTIPKKDLRKILQRIESLTENATPLRFEKLTGEERYRLRQGRYRILYSIQDHDRSVWVVKVGHRKGIYR